MKQGIITALLLSLCLGAFALSSTTNTAIFTLDTISPQLVLNAPNGGGGGCGNHLATCFRDYLWHTHHPGWLSRAVQRKYLRT